MKRTQILALLLMFATVAAHAQDAETKLRLAQGFEQAAEWERAASLYEELHQSDRANYVYFDGLQRSYTQLKQYPKAIALVQERLGWFPNDPLLLTTLGGLYYDSGNERAADSVWHATLAIDPVNASIYRLVASQQLDHRLYDDAIATYRAARTATRNDNLFADDLGGLYSAMQQYDAATREYLRLLKQSPQQLSYVESRIASFTIRTEGVSAARSVVADEVKLSPNDVTLRSLLAWVAMEAKDFEAAYREYVEIDKFSRANGSELFNFANRVSSEKAFAVAARAFHDVIEQSTNKSLLPYVRFGFARALEELSASDTTATSLSPADTDTIVSEARPSAQGALRMYRQVVEDYPNTDIAAQAWYRTGIMKFERFFDLDGALDAFTNAKAISSMTPTGLEAWLKIADVLLAKNDLARARAELQSLSQTSQVLYQDRAVFRLAELDYFEGKFDDALGRLKRFTGNLASDLSNDALLLNYFLLENKDSAPQALAEFAKADLLIRQRKFSESLAQFQLIVTTYPAALLVDDATMKIADLQLRLNHPTDALATLRHLLADMPTSIWKDKAQFRIGEIYETTLKDKAQAIAAYEELLTKYPASLYAEESRKRVRQLRGDNL